GNMDRMKRPPKEPIRDSVKLSQPPRELWGKPQTGSRTDSRTSQQTECLYVLMAERGGFEPPVELMTLRRFSKPLLSTTQPPLREGLGRVRILAQFAG